MRRANLIKIIVLVVVLGAAAGVGYVGHQIARVEQPGVVTQSQLFTVSRGESARSVARRLLADKPGISPFWQELWLRFHPGLWAIRAGTYQLDAGWSLPQALDWLVNGSQYQFRLTFIEGSELSEWLKQLQGASHLEHPQPALTAPAIVKALGASHTNLEGLLLPDTYLYVDGETELDILRQAYTQMQQFLQSSWADRSSGLPYKTPYQALIMASMIEKETGASQERSLIASVFVNRLRRNMRLQSDPTVIYALGNSYDGRLSRRDLRVASPYNTYRVRGLPPTPIAMPGRASILAALHPAKSAYLYFVAKGDGTHYFSKTLAEHNRAVRRYILNRK
ncbi:endolytic transglycosylase MltG [Dongshaea marina]|uniref:endolytic transglycosylase MltG n=1 Tax=Dongshaea marina TaxID=2047966 RepID=UPI000D3ED6EE|nr:endolytic transglycosylase MltG [Dongshaea marina]